VLFSHAHVGDRHATIHGLAHVVDREQRDLHGLRINNLAI
jgi:hypothetical protein